MYSVPEVGDIINDRYRIEEVLDRKQETIIYKCLDLRLDVLGVVKYLLDVVNPSLSVDLKSRFIEGARIQARLNHPNIVHVTNIESRQDVTFSVMELLFGDSLETHISQNRISFSFKEVLEIFIAVVDALSMAHEQGVLHKYLNPSNVILNQQGNRLTPRILNFSAYKESRMLNPYTALPFLAPEQFEGDDRAVPESDIFSIGAMLFFVFTKSPPFIADSFDRFVQYYKQYEFLRALPPEIPPPFVPIIQKALHKDPEQRHESASELLNELKSLAPRNSLSPNLSIEVPKVIRERSSTNPSQPALVKHGSRSSQPALSQHGSDPAQPVRHQTQSSQPIIARRSTSHSQPSLPSHDAAALAQNEFEALPAQLSSIYDFVSQVSQTRDTRVVLVRAKGNPGGELLCLKYLLSTNPTQETAFKDALKQQQSLADKSPYIQPIIAIHPEANAFVCSNEPRQSLRHYAETYSALDPLFVMRSFALIAEAMICAHEQGAVHAGLSSENLFLVQKGALLFPMVFDFAQRRYPSTKEDIRASQAAFVAPELHWQREKSNEQSDIFSFGMLMNFAILGHSPYKQVGDEKLLSHIESLGQSPSLSTLQADVNPNFIKVIDWCTAHDPAYRYRSFAEVRRDIYAVISPYL